MTLDILVECIALVTINLASLGLGVYLGAMFDKGKDRNNV